MKQYKRYKPSGIEWIGEIPEHWDIKKLKYMTDNLDKNRIPLSSSERSVKQGEYPYYGATGIIDHVDGYIFDGEYVLIGEDGAPFFEKNRDVAFVASEKFWVNNHAHILRARESYLPKFIAHQLNCVDYREYITGSTRDKLTQDELNEIRLINIPKEEQARIIDYLGHKTVQIEDLIAKKQNLIDLLNEEKTAMINHAVTRGLNPDAPMKDSGIPWMGKMPAHWEVKKLKWYFQLSRGVDLSSDNFVVGEVPVYGSNGCIGYHNESTTKGPGVTIGRSGSVGEVNFIGEDFWAHNTCLFVYKNFGNNWKYIFYFLKNLDLKSLSSGSAVGTLNRNYIHDERTAFPPLLEQTAIVQHIEGEIQKIDTTMSKIEKEIELLQEYRTALISEAVTGKIDVRGVN